MCFNAYGISLDRQKNTIDPLINAEIHFNENDDNTYFTHELYPEMHIIINIIFHPLRKLRDIFRTFNK